VTRGCWTTVQEYKSDDLKNDGGDSGGGDGYTIRAVK
jgi:hypothetical protein